MNNMLKSTLAAAAIAVGVLSANSAFATCLKVPPMDVGNNCDYLQRQITLGERQLARLIARIGQKPADFKIGAFVNKDAAVKRLHQKLTTCEAARRS